MKRHYFRSTRKLLTAAAFAALTLPAMANDIVDGGEYYIISDYFDKALGLDSVATYASTTPALSDFGYVTSEGAYVFVAEQSSTANYFYLRNKATGKYLTASTANNWSLVWKDNKGTGNEYLWKLDVQMGRTIVSKKNTSAMLGIDWSTDQFIRVYYNKSYNSTARFTVVPVVEGGLEASLAAAKTSVFTNDQGRQEKDIYCVSEKMELSDDIDLHLTSTKPIAKGAEINITNPKAWIILDNVSPSKAFNYLQYIKLNGSKVTNNKNIRVAIYLDGAAIIPFARTTEAVLTGYTEQNMGGEKIELTSKNATTLNSGDVKFNNRIRSLVLKRGFMALVGTGENSGGYTRVYVADHADLELATLPEALDQRISSIHIKPWQYTPKKGWCSTKSDENIASQMTQLNASWFYTWSADRKTTTNAEYVPIRQHYYWPSLSTIKALETSTHALLFNEPDHSEQHENCSCGGTISAWNATVKTKDMNDMAMRIGSPAPTDLSWSKEYFGHVDDMGYRCDFSVIHAYWGPNEANGASAWESRLKDLYNNTKRPIWITEWAYGASWTKEEWPTAYKDQLEKNRAAIFEIVNKLESLPYVERYSYYQWDTSSRRFINDDGWMTPAGDIYKRTRSTFSYNSKYQVAPKWWRPSTKTASIAFKEKTDDGVVTLCVANPMGDYTQTLTLEHYDNASGTWQEIQKWDDRTAFDADTLTYDVDLASFDRFSDRYRVHTTTIFGGDVVSGSFDMGYITNPDCSDGTNGWTVSGMDTNKGEASDGDENNTYWDRYVNKAFTSSMKQTLTDLPEGEYTLSMLIRGATNFNAVASLTARPAEGEARTVSANYTGQGNTTIEGSGYQNGWTKLTLDPLAVNAGEEVDIEVSGKADASSWWSLDDFSLAFKSTKVDGIETVVASGELDETAPAYSIDGRRVDPAKYKGLIIQRGKKVIRK